MQCNYEFTHVFWRLWQEENEVAVYIQGSAHADGMYLQDVVFYNKNTGLPVGRAIGDVAKSLPQLLFHPDSWDGFIKLDSFQPIELEVVAYGKNIRCQPWITTIAP